eukprot:CAMPEP_0201237024 /NCGR_PEP_ID=MMETSP0852-20130820/8357_1 /ASSEMBLY_ACC=CAM_ASM_000632 /TAXON_ID=183588 /ORGANISM="Pseudo-nitzschia fraudulenta, Strain WWA7" /LENGTH=39 /DNA_ID= /DNA_START= /DNA_END= /DNA_ORIENTATION=
MPPIPAFSTVAAVTFFQISEIFGTIAKRAAMASLEAPSA